MESNHQSQEDAKTSLHQLQADANLTLELLKPFAKTNLVFNRHAVICLEKFIEQHIDEIIYNKQQHQKYIQIFGAFLGECFNQQINSSWLIETRLNTPLTKTQDKNGNFYTINVFKFFQDYFLQYHSPINISILYYFDSIITNKHQGSLTNSSTNNISFIYEKTDTANWNNQHSPYNSSTHKKLAQKNTPLTALIATLVIAYLALDKLYQYQALNRAKEPLVLLQEAQQENTQTSTFNCAVKKQYCSQMNSKQEIEFYNTNCHYRKYLDSNKNGILCEQADQDIDFRELYYRNPPIK